MCSALLDAHLFHGNELGLDLYNITWRRVLDVNDRALRNMVVGMGGRLDGVPREPALTSPPLPRSWQLSLCAPACKIYANVGTHRRCYTKAGTPVTAEELKVAARWQSS